MSFIATTEREVQVNEDTSDLDGLLYTTINDLFYYKEGVSLSTRNMTNKKVKIKVEIIAVDLEE